MFQLASSGKPNKQLHCLQSENNGEGDLHFHIFWHCFDIRHQSNTVFGFVLFLFFNISLIFHSRTLVCWSPVQLSKFEVIRRRLLLSINLSSVYMQPLESFEGFEKWKDKFLVQSLVVESGDVSKDKLKEIVRFWLLVLLKVFFLAVGCGEVSGKEKWIQKEPIWEKAEMPVCSTQKGGFFEMDLRIIQALFRETSFRLVFHPSLKRKKLRETVKRPLLDQRPQP